MENIDLTPLKGMRFMVDTEVVSTNPNISTVLGSKGVITQLQQIFLNVPQSHEIQRVDPLKFLIFDCVFNNGEEKP